MDDVLTFLIGLVCVLAAVTVVGHGIWVLLATIVRGIDQSSARANLPSRKPCPQCGAKFGIELGRCVVCGSGDPRLSQPSQRDELLATARQMKRLLSNGSLSQEQYDHIAALISADLQHPPTASEGLVPASVKRTVREASRPPHFASPAVSPTTSPQTRTEPGGGDDAIAAELVEEPPRQPAVVPRTNLAGSSTVFGELESHPTDSSPFAPSHQRPSPDPFDGAARTPAPPHGPPSTPPAPRQTLADMLQSFLEESNIRWGEIIAGFFIVISSIGLVISLQSTLERIPYFPALLFTGFTVAFHGAGLYTLKRWNLHAISRVILVISLLLVPLTASAAVLLSRRPVDAAAQQTATPWLFWLVLAVGACALSWVAYTSSRELVGPSKWRLSLCVIGCSLAQVFFHRMNVAPSAFWSLNGLAALPLGCFLIAVVGQLILGRRWPQLSWRKSQQTLIVLGVALFALIAAFAMLLLRSDERVLAAARLSPALSLAAGATMALGLLIHRRTTARALAGVRTAGTVILLLGGAAMLVSVVLAWPEPELLFGVGLVNGLLLIGLAIGADLAILHAPAIACLALAALLGFHWMQGRFDGVPVEALGLKIVEAMLMGRSSALLLALAVAAASGALGATRLRWSDDARIIIGASAVLALGGVIVALFAGFIPVTGWVQDRHWMAPLLAIYAAALLAASPFAPWPQVAGVGSFVLFAALLQALGFNAPVREWLDSHEVSPRKPLLAALVAHALISGVLMLIAIRGAITANWDRFAEWCQSRRYSHFAEPLAVGAALSLLAAIPLLFFGRTGRPFEPAVLAGIAVLPWLAIVVTTRWNWAVSATQTMLFLSPALAIAAYCQQSIGSGWVWSLDHLSLQLTAAAIGAIPWSIARRALERQREIHDLLVPDWPAVDEVVLFATTVFSASLAWVVAVPAIAWELGYPEIHGPVQISEPSRFGIVTWLVLAITSNGIALLASSWQRVRMLTTAGLGVATSALVPAVALMWMDEVAVASATRWCAAIFTALWGVAFIARRPIRTAFRTLPWLRWTRIDRKAAHGIFGALPLVLGGLPILVLTVLAVSQNAAGIALRGPLEGSVFDQIGPTASYAVPLLAIVGVLLGYAVREREAAFALGGSLVFQLAINLAFMLHVALGEKQPPTLRAAEWLQWNGIGAAAYAVVWLGLLRWMIPDGKAASGRFERARVMLGGQVVVAVMLAIGIVGWAGASVFLEPSAIRFERLVLGHWLSYVGVALACLAAGWFAWRFLQNLERVGVGSVVFWLVVGVVALAAATLDRFDATREWLAYHAIIAGWLSIALVATGLSSWRFGGAPQSGDPARAIDFAPWHGFVAALCLLLVGFAIRGNSDDPGGPWWSFATGIGVVIATTLFGVRRGSQPYAYAATATSALTMILLWSSPALRAWRTSLASEMVPLFAEALALVLVLAAGFWQSVEILMQKRYQRSLDQRSIIPRSHAVTLIGLLPIYLLWRLFMALFSHGAGDAFTYYDGLGLLAVCTWAVVLGWSLWDRRAWFALPLLFAWLMALALLVVSVAGPYVVRIDGRLALMTLAGGLIVALAGQLWSYGANLSLIGSRLGVDDPIAGLKRTERWLPAVCMALTALVSLLGLALVLTVRQDAARTAVAFAPVAAAWGIACLADDLRRPHFRLVSLLVGGLTAIFLAWAQLGVDLSAPVWLTRLFRLLMVLAVLTFIYGLALPRWLLTSGMWNAATRKAGYIAGAAAIAAFVSVLVMEVGLFEPGVGAGVDTPQVVAIAVVLFVLIAGLISMALLPGRDPLLLAEKGRQVYVYAALAVAALLFVHLYVCRPMWFDAGLIPYWPLIVMAIAFIGAGGGELFSRYGIKVLAEPLIRVGSLLPLLPVLGMWIVAPKETDYALVLLVVGVLYVMISVTQRSWAALVAAAVAGNGALWTVLHRTGFELLANPQLWLIPPAACVLLAAQVNRKRLPPSALTAIRYACTLLIYVSSTSEIFLRGVATSLWPAMVLATLSVIGAFVGMALRIRAFLYLGASFALVSLITMVAHAARAIDHVWPWWAFGVGLGIAILILFGVFEKKREEMLALVKRLREWEQ